MRRIMTTMPIVHGGCSRMRTTVRTHGSVLVLVVRVIAKATVSPTIVRRVTMGDIMGM